MNDREFDIQCEFRKNDEGQSKKSAYLGIYIRWTNITNVADTMGNYPSRFERRLEL